MGDFERETDLFSLLKLVEFRDLLLITNGFWLLVIYWSMPVFPSLKIFCSILRILSCTSPGLDKYFS